jgi:hypothetical protein
MERLGRLGVALMPDESELAPHVSLCALLAHVLIGILFGERCLDIIQCELHLIAIELFGQLASDSRPDITSSTRTSIIYKSQFTMLPSAAQHLAPAAVTSPFRQQARRAAPRSTASRRRIRSIVQQA